LLPCLFPFYSFAAFSQIPTNKVFAYGQTGSGKTHTMLGEPGEPGLMGRTLTELFSVGSGSRFNVSFIEVYNEEIRDLLSPGNSSGSGPGLDLREDPLKGPQVKQKKGKEKKRKEKSPSSFVAHTGLCWFIASSPSLK